MFTKRVPLALVFVVLVAVSLEPMRAYAECYRFIDTYVPVCGDCSGWVCEPCTPLGSCYGYYRWCNQNQQVTTEDGNKNLVVVFSPCWIEYPCIRYEHCAYGTCVADWDNPEELSTERSSKNKLTTNCLPV